MHLIFVAQWVLNEINREGTEVAEIWKLRSIHIIISFEMSEIHFIQYLFILRVHDGKPLTGADSQVKLVWSEGTVPKRQSTALKTFRNSN